MKIAIATFNGFNELDSFIASAILNRVDRQKCKAEITSPSETVVSMNGVEAAAQKPLEFYTCRQNEHTFMLSTLNTSFHRADPL